MYLFEVKDQDKQDYNRFVAGQQAGSFLQSWEWGQWQEKLGREVYRFKMVDDAGNFMAAAQLIKMPLPFGQYYLYAPYGPVADLGWKIENLNFLFQELKKKFVGCVFFRIEPKNEPLPAANRQLLTKTKNIQPGKTLVIDLTKPEEELLAAMHHKTRYNIRLAQKHGCEVQDEFVVSPGHGLYYQEAVELIIKTSRRQGFAGYPKSYYYQLIDFFALGKAGELKLHIYKVLYRKQLLASAIMLDFGAARTFLFGGSSDEHRNVMAPYLLHFQAMLDAKAQGKSVYDFWGAETAGGEQPGFVRFKMGFGGQLVSYTGAVDVICRSGWYGWYKLLRKINKILRKWIR